MFYVCKVKKAQIYINTAKKSAQQVKTELGCDAVINGGLYDMAKLVPYCHLKVDGKVLAKDPYKYFGYGWDTGADISLVSDYAGKRNYICCVCMVRNGKAENMYVNPDMGGARQRTAIGLYPDGRLWLYADAAPKTPEQLRKIALDAGLDSALMLDGGGSTQCAFPGGNVKSARAVHNYICVWAEAAEPEKEPAKEPEVRKPTIYCPYKEPSVNIRRGSTGEGARWAQYMLNQHGAVLAVDGIFGTNSREALVSFQRKSALAADGICGKLTRAALKK